VIDPRRQSCCRGGRYSPSAQGAGCRRAELGSPGSRIRELWRLRRGGRLLTAVLYQHDHGIELRTEPEPGEGSARVIHSRIEVSNIAAVELDGEGVRHHLRDSGWLDVADDA